MANCNILDFYSSLCKERQIELHPHVLQALQEMKLTGNITLKLTGNSRLRCFQRLNDKDIWVLSECLKNSRSLTGLDLKLNNITDGGVRDLAQLLRAGSSTLTSLDLAFNDITTSGAEVLAMILQDNTTLLSLSLSGNKIGNRGAMHLVSMLQVNNTLKTLELANCDLATESVIAFAVMLKSNTSLCSLDLSRPLLFSHQEEWAVDYSQMLKVNSSLVELHLGKMGMTDTGMERLTEGLRLNHSLRYLDLRCNRVTRDGVHHLAKVLQQNLTLEIIDLSANQIEDEGALYLSEAIGQGGCSLRELSVTNNNIRTNGLLSLAQAMTTNNTLNHIYIWGNHLDEPVCQAFRELISSGRLPVDQTDVSAYEVDGQMFLAEVCNSLRRRYNKTDNSNSTSSPTLKTEPELLTETKTSPESKCTPHPEAGHLVPLQDC